jgi:hypothetical protein
MGSFAQQLPPHKDTAPPSATARADDAASMKDDIQKMRLILNQMQTNLAFVGNSTTPLNHQFELEISMWRVLLDQMDRKVDRASGSKATAPEKPRVDTAGRP